MQGTCFGAKHQGTELRLPAVAANQMHDPPIMNTYPENSRLASAHLSSGTPVPPGVAFTRIGGRGYHAPPDEHHLFNNPSTSTTTTALLTNTLHLGIDVLPDMLHRPPKQQAPTVSLPSISLDPPHFGTPGTVTDGVATSEALTNATLRNVNPGDVVQSSGLQLPLAQAVPQGGAAEGGREDTGRLSPRCQNSGICEPDEISAGCHEGAAVQDSCLLTSGVLLLAMNTTCLCIVVLKFPGAC